MIVTSFLLLLFISTLVQSVIKIKVLRYLNEQSRHSQTDFTNTCETVTIIFSYFPGER